MAIGWSADEQANLLLAWATMNEEEGTLEGLYGHFVQLCERDPPRSRSVVFQRKQTLSYVCKFIASYASPEPEKPRASNGSSTGGDASASSNDADNPAGYHPWFQLTPAERSDKFAALKTKQYAFVDLDLATFREVERLKAGVKVVKTTSSVEWSRDELLALVHALGDAIDEPPRSRQCNENTAMFRRFVSRCGGETKRTSQSTVSKMEATMNMVRIISEFNRARKESCNGCYEKNNWFALAPAARKTCFDERNVSSHRFLEVDEELYEEAAPALRKWKSGEAPSSEDPPPAAARARSLVADVPPVAAARASATTITIESEEKESEPAPAESTPSATEEPQAEVQEAGVPSLATTSEGNSGSNGPDNGVSKAADCREDPVQDRATYPAVVLAWKAGLEKDVADMKIALEQAHMRVEAVEQRLVETLERDKKRKRDDKQAMFEFKTALDEQRRGDHAQLEFAVKIQELEAENRHLIKQLQADQRQTLLWMKERLRSDDKERLRSDYKERTALTAQVQRQREGRRADLKAQIKLLKELLDDERESERREGGRRSRY